MSFCKNCAASNSTLWGSAITANITDHRKDTKIFIIHLFYTQINSKKYDIIREKQINDQIENEVCIYKVENPNFTHNKLKHDLIKQLKLHLLPRKAGFQAWQAINFPTSSPVKKNKNTRYYVCYGKTGLLKLYFFTPFLSPWIWTFQLSLINHVILYCIGILLFLHH